MHQKAAYDVALGGEKIENRWKFRITDGYGGLFSSP
jgi:hypothetical protein